MSRRWQWKVFLTRSPNIPVQHRKLVSYNLKMAVHRSWGCKWLRSWRRWRHHEQKTNLYGSRNPDLGLSQLSNRTWTFFVQRNYSHLLKITLKILMIKRRFYTGFPDLVVHMTTFNFVSPYVTRKTETPSFQEFVMVLIKLSLECSKSKPGIHILNFPIKCVACF